MKNKISDLRNHMFAALERLSNEDMTADEMKAEIEKARAVSEVGKVIVESAKVEVLHLRMRGKLESERPVFLENEDEEPKKIERAKW